MNISLENNLEKGHLVNLERADGSKITEFCIGVNWGAIRPSTISTRRPVEETAVAVDLDLNCILVDVNGEVCDYVNCAAYRTPESKLETDDGALKHSGDDAEGDKSGDDGLDNETVTVNLSKVSSNVSQIFFFLNNLEKKDFSKIPYVKIRLYERTPTQVNPIFAIHYDVSANEYSGKRAIIAGKLCKKGSEWEFCTIGDATDDKNLLDTIERILKSYL
jgi:tellurium resistance protein TerZ